MAVLGHPSALLGISIGTNLTRANFFGKPEGKYRVLASQQALTSIGQGLHLGVGVGESLNSLQTEVDWLFLKQTGGLIMPVDHRLGRGIDQVAITVSAGTRVPTMLLGVSEQGSIKAGKSLLSGMPIELLTAWGVGDIVDDAYAIEALLKISPKILVIVGGEDTGTAAPVLRWIDIVRTGCELLPAPLRPTVLYAGTHEHEAMAKRRLEPVTKLFTSANIQPVFGKVDFVPARNALEKIILDIWRSEINGLPGLLDLTKELYGLETVCVDRVVRFFGYLNTSDRTKRKSSTLAVNLGAKYTSLSMGFNNHNATILQDKFSELGSEDFYNTCQSIYNLLEMDLSSEAVEQYLANHSLHPNTVPETIEEMALTQAFARHRLKMAIEALSENYPWFAELSKIEPQPQLGTIFVSGLEMTSSLNSGWGLLTLLNAIQPCGITNFIIDRFHLLPLLGKIGEIEPLLAIQILDSNAFETFVTTISTVGALPHGQVALTVYVESEFGKSYSADIQSGELKRLLIPSEGNANISFSPHENVDIGFGGKGQGGQITLPGGGLGMVIDARGRALNLPHERPARIEWHQKWLRAMGVDLG